MAEPKFSKDIIEAAIAGFESRKLRIDEQIAQLRGQLDDAPMSTVTAVTGRGKFSPATIQKMRESQRRRWAKVRGESEATASSMNKVKPRRRLSAAGRKAIAEAARKMWAERKAAKAA